MGSSRQVSRRVEVADLAATVLLIPVLIWEVTRPDRHAGAVLVANTVLFAVLLAAFAVRVRTVDWAETPVGVKAVEVGLLAVAVPGLAAHAGPLRLFRILRLPLLGVRTLRGLRTRLVRKGATLVGLMATMTVLAGSLMVLEFEARNSDSMIRGLGDAAWWTITTMTTVGYGDEYPSTAGGRMVGVVVMLVGISLFGLVTALLAQWFLGGDAQGREKSDAALLAEEVAALRVALAAVERPPNTERDEA